MAIKSKAQIQAESNSTYIDNSVGAITPNSVRALNTDWIDSIIFAEATASLTVFAATSASFANSASRADSAATASFLTGTVASASYAIQAGTASVLLGSVESASFATSASRAISSDTATSASYSLTSSLAQRNLITASAAANILTFTKGDGTTFNVSIAQSGSVQSASFADTANQANSASLAQNSLLLQGTGSNGFVTTASFATTSGSLSTRVTNLESFSSSLNNTFATDAELNAATQSLSASISTVNSRLTVVSSSLLVTSASLLQVSASYIALSASYNTSSGSASTRITNLESFSSSLDATFATDAQLNAATQSLSASISTVNTRVTEVSGSLLQVSASYVALSGSYNTASGSLSTRVSNNTSNIQTLTSATASYAVLGNNQTFTGTNTFNNAVTMSNVRVTGTASIAFLDVQFQSSSIIYSSGSNQLGDAPNDTQTLWGTVDIISGPLVVTGSANFKETITGSISGNAATATTSTSASYAFTASSAISASFASNGGVTQLLAGPNITLSPTSGKGQVTISATGGGGSFFNTATGSYGSFYDTTTQTNPVPNVARSMSFNETDISNGVSISGSVNPFNTYIKTENAGVYNLQFSAQIDKTDGGTDDIVIWLRKNGIDLAETATTITLPTNNSKAVAAWNWFVTSAANDYYQIIWSSADIDLRILAVPANLIHPGIPSIIATANRVDQFLSNTGSFSGSFSGALTGSLFGTASWAVNAISAATASFTPNAFVSASNPTAQNNQIAFYKDGNPLTNNVVTIDNVQSASYADNANTANSATSASYSLTASYLEGSVSAFPFTGSARITGSLDVIGRLYVPSGSFEITGSATINSGSLVMFSYKNATPSNRPFQALVTQSLNSTNNIISISQTIANSGSIVISGSGNYVSLTGVQTNLNFANGATSGFNGQNAYVTIMPVISGSNPLVNTAADRNNRFVPALVNSNINGTLTVTDNRQTESSSPVNFSSVNQIGSITVRIDSGSLSTSQTLIGGLANVLEITGSGTTAISNSTLSNSILIGNGNNIIYRATGSGTTGINQSIISGNANRILITTSSSLNSTTVTNPIFNNSLIVGQTLIVTGSTNTANGMTLLGNFNAADGLLNDPRFTTFAIGTGTSAAARGTAFHVSASGMTTVNVGLNVRGVQTGETELEVRATGVKIGNLITDAHNLTGSFAISGSQTITGSLVAQTVTASFSGSGAQIFGVVSSSYAINSDTASFTPNAFVSASNYLTKDTLVLFKGDGAQSLVIINNVESASYADNANTANSATSATSASYAYTASSAISAGTASYATQFIVSGSQVITGSLVGQPISQSVASSTASLNLAQGNFFNLTLPASTNTYITASGQVPGQTINLKITQQATTGSVTLGAGFKQVSGSAYTVTATANAVDIVTFISFDNTGLYVSNVKNLI